MSEKIKARDSRAVDPFEDADEQVKAWAKARQEPTGTSKPVRSWTTVDASPPTHEATTGVPQAMASNTTMPNDS